MVRSDNFIELSIFQGRVQFPTGGTVRDPVRAIASADPVKLRDQQ